jgi:hypothetical protein
MYAWILQHDDRWSFIALYVSLAVVLSMWISLFWLVALVAASIVVATFRPTPWHDPDSADDSDAGSVAASATPARLGNRNGLCTLHMN